MTDLVLTIEVVMFIAGIILGFCAANISKYYTDAEDYNEDDDFYVAKDVIEDE